MTDEHIHNPGPSSSPAVGDRAGGQAILVYACADLLWATKIKSTGEQIGVVCRPVRSLDMLRARLADSRVVAMLVDLETGSLALELIGALRGPGAGPAERSVRIVAFGPHVEVGKMAAARESGADAVLAQGALARSLPDLLGRLESGRAAAIESHFTD